VTEGIERFVPEAGKASLMAAEHVARYQLAAQLVRGRSVLDAACGAGYGTAMLASAGARSVTGVDIALDAVPPPRPGITFATGDLRCLPFDDASFECVVCFEAIEHVTEPDQVIDEFARVLTANGVLVLSTPNRLVNPPGNPYHVFEYTPDELRGVLVRRFSHVATLTQHPFAGSLIEVPDDAIGADTGSQDLGGLDLELIDRATVARLQSLEPDREQYTIALASGEALPRLEKLRSVAILGAAVELRWWYEQLDTSAQNEREATVRADEAERRCEVLETENRFITEQARRLGARLLVGEQENADILSTRAETVRLNDELTASRIEVDGLQRQLDVLLASRSLRLTRPARQVFATVRHLLGRNRS
jgi:SAM-dependent methyltransferase